MLENEDDIFKAKRLVDALRAIELDWLEAVVLMHHYLQDQPLEYAADIAGVHVRDILAARRSLVTKVAVALGYINHDEATAFVQNAAWRDRRAAS